MFRFIACKITRGGFSSERVFEIDVSGRAVVGMAHVDFVRKDDGSPIGDEPPPGATIEGYVQCRVIKRTGDDVVLVELPSGELVPVSEGSLTPADELQAA
jgi:hypothetical protein